MAEPTNDVLAQWLMPASGVLEPSDLKAYQAALAHVLGKSTGKRALDLVLLGSGGDEVEPSQWLDALVRAKKPDLPNANKALLGRLAAAAVVRGLDPDAGVVANQHVLIGLAVQSAQFAGLAPALPEISTFAAASLTAAAAGSRLRDREWQAVTAEIGALLEGTVETTDPTSGEVRPADDGHAGAILRLAEAIDEMGARFDERLDLVDEEYDSLWWSYTAQSESTQTKWAEITPLALRVVIIAQELGAKLSRVPAPPMVPGLVALALGDQKDKKLSLVDVAEHVSSRGARVVADAKHRLLPISSAVAEASRLKGDAAVWPAALNAALGIDATKSNPAIAVALQLIREEEIGSLLA